MLARQAEAGRCVAVLGMFDQGFNDRVGFGTGAYTSAFTFDPDSLRIDVGFRPLKRLTRDQWRDMHGAQDKLLNIFLVTRISRLWGAFSVAELLPRRLSWSNLH